MKFPVIEIVDRYAIALVKHNKTSGANQEELDFYLKQMGEINIDINHELILELISVHDRGWDLEDDIKQGRIDHRPLEEIGRRALDMRDLMKNRVILKNALAELVDDPIREIKKYPDSE